MAALVKDLQHAKRENAKADAVSMQLKAKLQSMEEKLTITEQARVTAIAMVGKSDKLYRDLIRLKQPSAKAFEEQSPEMKALTEALNKRLKDVQDICLFIKVAAEQAMNMTTKTTCSKMLETFTN